VPWTCDIYLKFDNGAEIRTDDTLAGTYTEVSAQDTSIDFNTEYLDDGEEC